jgi:hypothetical protein
MYLSSLFQAPLNGVELNQGDQDLMSDVATLQLHNHQLPEGSMGPGALG